MDNIIHVERLSGGGGGRGESGDCGTSGSESKEVSDSRIWSKDVRGHNCRANRLC